MQKKGQPIMILTCQHDSHYFEERSIVVDDIIKVGRAVARSKVSPNNAIFDCKVLSRNHAVVWFSSDEFWLRDTNSSNGTFVNNTRISKREDVDYCDRQIFSGDVVRFGVDVVEQDVTHSCIIASVTLILPNGQEAKPKLGLMGDVLPSGLISINYEQLFQISCFLNDAIFREQVLDKKLEALRQALQQANLASELGWQAILNEEKLLQKFDLYESQVRLFKEELPENSLKIRLSNLLDEKSLQEAESKNQLTKLIKDKEIVLQRVQDLERTIEDLQRECTHLRNEYASAQGTCNNISDEYKTNLSTISQHLSELTTERNHLNDQLQHAFQEANALKEQLKCVSDELATVNKSNEVQLKGSPVLINGLSSVNEELHASTYSNDAKTKVDSCNAINDVIKQDQSAAHVSRDEIMVDSSKSEASEYISDSIRDFHRALELIRILAVKVAALAVTTDLDEGKKFEENSGSVPYSNSPEDTSDVLSLSFSSMESLVKRIVRHNEAAMTSLHAYLRQVNPSAATELINKIYLGNSGFDEGPEASGADTEGRSLSKRPDFLTLGDSMGRAVDTVASSSVCDEGVRVVDANSLNTSPTVSSGNGFLSFSMSPNAEEIVHLQECVRLANIEAKQYKALIVELQKTGRNKGVLTTADAADCAKETTSEQDLEAMHAEYCVLRARLGDIEEQMEQTRENHRRLVDEAHQHRAEVEQLRSQRAELETALALSQAQITKLHQQTLDQHHPRSSTSVSHNHFPSTTSYIADPPVHVDRLELVPGRLVTMSSLIVISIMLLVFAVMFAIFSKFVS